MRRWIAGFAALICLGASTLPPGVALEALMAQAPAPRLSDYHLFTDLAGRQPNAGLTPYGLNSPLFTDYAVKSRFVFLPKGKSAVYTKHGVLDFPVGTVLIKTFAYPADMRRPNEAMRSIETRLLIRKASGWVAQTYRWNADQTDAVLKRAGARADVSFIDQSGQARRIDYAIPNQNQCKECHQLDETLTPIGPKARNLNGTFAYAEGQENQLTYWSRRGLLGGVPPLSQVPRTERWNDTSAPLNDRARAYLDANCAHCHNPSAAASNSGLFLSLEEENRSPALGFGKQPVAAGRGAGDLKVGIDPGHPDRSILTYRMGSIEPGVMMPELGRTVLDDEGLDLIRQWIGQMKAQ